MKVEMFETDGNYFFIIKVGGLSLTICYDPKLNTIEIENPETTEVQIFKVGKNA